MNPLDLNADLGESPDRLADDLALLAIVTSANIACGGHAGDQASMDAMVHAASRLNVAIGAHPSFPDVANFGRLDMDLPPATLEASLRDQVRALHRAATARGTRITHVKPHGALYHAASRRPAVAQAVALAATESGPGVILVGQAGSAALTHWAAMGFRVAPEAFSDRRYEPDGSLRARTLPGAVLHDPAEAAAQALRLATGVGVLASNGSVVPVTAETLCVHSDSPGAVSIARAVRLALEQAGLGPAPLRF